MRAWLAHGLTYSSFPRRAILRIFRVPGQATDVRTRVRPWTSSTSGQTRKSTASSLLLRRHGRGTLLRSTFLRPQRAPMHLWPGQGHQRESQELGAVFQLCAASFHIAGCLVGASLASRLPLLTRVIAVVPSRWGRRTHGSHPLVRSAGCARTPRRDIGRGGRAGETNVRVRRSLRCCVASSTTNWL